MAFKCSLQAALLLQLSEFVIKVLFFYFYSHIRMFLSEKQKILILFYQESICVMCGIEAVFLKKEVFIDSTGKGTLIRESTPSYTMVYEE